MLKKRLVTALVAGFLLFGVSGMAVSADELSLITDTPEEGFALAVKLSQKGVATVQPNAKVRKKHRSDYAEDAEDLIAVSGVIATNFQTVAAANNYWRD